MSASSKYAQFAPSTAGTDVPRDLSGESVGSREAERLVSALFEVIDSRRWDALELCFHPEARYVRPGYEPLDGLIALIDFYRHRRIIRSGRHSVEVVCVGPRGTISASGSFMGTDRDDRPLSLRFCDVYLLEGPRIKHRETFFHAPLA